jgi:hypothetical protein
MVGGGQKKIPPLGRIPIILLNVYTNQARIVVRLCLCKPIQVRKEHHKADESNSQ